MNATQAANQASGIRAAIDSLKLSMTSEFVPWNEAQHGAVPALHWRITLLRDGKPILTTDYMAGCGHCPSYKQGTRTVFQQQMVEWECANGRQAIDRGGSIGIVGSSKKIEPKFADVLYSLVLDAEVINVGGFEEWADCYGYDADSRKAEGIYRACLDIALKLRAAIGDDGMQTLATAFQDY